MEIRSPVARALMGAVLFGSAVLCGLPRGAQAESDDLLSAMAHVGAARIAIAALPPYAYLQPNGSPQGYTIDVSSEVMKAYGIPKLAPTVSCSGLRSRGSWGFALS
jgi:ABC-type amino acid transport substrate-binding protein